MAATQSTRRPSPYHRGARWSLKIVGASQQAYRGWSRADGDTKTELSRRTLEGAGRGSRRAPRSPQAPGGQAAPDRRSAAGQRSRLLHPHRHSARGRERPPVVPGHHQGGRHRGGLDPRELRHSFVSILSANGVSIEEIADLVGHKTTVVTQKVYRHQLKPVITTGATMMNSILDRQKGARSA